jgi:hypothetical protein
MMFNIGGAIVQGGVRSSSTHGEFRLWEVLVGIRHCLGTFNVDTQRADIVSARVKLDSPPISTNVGGWRTHHLVPVGCLGGAPDTLDLPGEASLLSRGIFRVFQISEEVVLPVRVFWIEV